MREVILHGVIAAGRVALVDDKDFELVSQYRWRAIRKRNGKLYASAWVGPRKTRKQVTMHRMLRPDWPLVDHKDGDGLNNQGGNFRQATVQQNLWNQKCYSKSGFKGVRPVVKSKVNPWQASIQGQYLGCFPTAEDAALAYDREAEIRFGEFAKLNFPEKACLIGA